MYTPAAPSPCPGCRCWLQVATNDFWDRHQGDEERCKGQTGRPGPCSFSPLGSQAQACAGAN